MSDSSGVQVQAGECNNKGIELQADLKLTDGLSTQLAYTHNDSTQDLNTKKTIHTPLIPNNQVAAKVSYAFTWDNLLNGLRVGASVRLAVLNTHVQYCFSFQPAY